MKIGYISDLHTEYESYTEMIFEKDLDVLIIAGDVGKKANKVEAVMVEILEALPENTKIFFVLGNHEYVLQLFDEVEESYEKMFAKFNGRVSLLINESEVYKGVKFVGSTLWSSFDNGNTTVINAALGRINDYYIKTYDSEKEVVSFSINDVQKLYTESYKFLKNELDNTMYPTVVITHFPASNQMMNLKYKDSPSVKYYCNHIPELFENKNVKAWVSGHTHVTVEDKNEGHVRLFSNPKGRVKDGVPNEVEDFKTNRYFTV